MKSFTFFLYSINLLIHAVVGTPHFVDLFLELGVELIISDVLSIKLCPESFSFAVDSFKPFNFKSGHV